MRKLYFDSFEFNRPESEEELHLVIAARSQYSDRAAFAADCEMPLAGSVPRSDWKQWEHVSDYVRRFAGIELPPLDRCSVLVLQDEWDDRELFIETPDQFIWYRWSTTA